MSKSKVVVVTGVSSGIGRAAAMKFAEQGCRVFGTVRNTAKAHAIPNVTLVEMDFRDEMSVESGIQTIIAQAQRIDVLVNSAGVTLLGAAEETSVEEAQKLFDTNLFGVLRVIRAVLPHMRGQRSGRIVNVSSVLGFLPAPYMALSIQRPSTPLKGWLSVAAPATPAPAGQAPGVQSANIFEIAPDASADPAYAKQNAGERARVQPGNSGAHLAPGGRGRDRFHQPAPQRSP